MEEKIVVKRPPKSPTLAGILSFFLPTTGALYNGQYVKFFIFLIAFAGLISMADASGHPIPGLLLGGFYFYQLFDSIQTSRAINKRFLRGDNGVEDKLEEVPEMVKSGSVFWGVILIALGFILLGANFGVISYGSLWDLWPLIVIVIGIKFLFDYFSKDEQEI